MSTSSSKYDITQLMSDYKSSLASGVGDVTVPIKSNEDTREYRHVTLCNGLSVLFVHDGMCDKSAAAMSVGVGHFADPHTAPGLAHFLEHMLFLGTEKYPNENEYKSYLSNYGGSSNAYTSTEETLYYFDIQQQHLHGALDRFAQFFIAPLFTPSSVERELNAVHNENSKNLLNDTWRLYQLLKTTSNQHHPFSKFGTGNLSTLRDTPQQNNIDVLKLLREFHAQYYSSNNMRLAIVGKESLDELQKWCEELFAAIPQFAVSSPPPCLAPFADAPSVASSSIFPVETLPALYRIVPVKQLRSLVCMWPLPTTTDIFWQWKPSNIIGHLMGHESVGSILSLLKLDKNYISSLSAGVHHNTTTFSIFAVSMEMTEEGEQHVEEIIEVIYSYIQLLINSLDNLAAWRSIFEEVKNIAALSFQFKSKEQPASYVQQLASDMHTYPSKHLLNAHYLYTEYRHDLIGEFLSFLKPSLMRAHIITQSQQAHVNLKEKWYGTDYSVDKWGEEQLNKFNNPRVLSQLALPQPNEFIATDFTIKHDKYDNDDEKNIDFAPRKIDLNAFAESAPSLVNHKFSQVFWKPDRIFRLPKVNILMRFLTPVAYSSPRTTLLSSLYAKLLEDSLNEYAYNAELAGLSYSFYSTHVGLQLNVYGYNHKIGKLVDVILQKMKTLVIDENAFARLRENTKRSLLNFANEQPYQFAMTDELLALEMGIWSHADRLAVIDDLTPQQVQQHINMLLSEAELEMLAHGNITQEEVVDFAAQIQQKLQLQPLFAAQLPDQRTVKYDSSNQYIRQMKNLNDHDTNSASVVIFQHDHFSVENAVLLDLLSHIAREPLFDQLRTKETLGYLLWSNCIVNRGILGFRVIVQSSNCDAFYLQLRVEAAIQWFVKEKFPAMLAEQPDFFKVNVDTLIAHKLEKDKTLGQETNRHWNEISLHRFAFNRRQQEVEQLRSLTLEQFQQFMHDFLLAEGKRTKLVVNYYGKNHELPPQHPVYNDDLISFANQAYVDKTAAASGASTSSDGAPASSSSDGADASAAKAVARPPVLLDTRPIVYIEDFNQFKKNMPLFPCYV